MEEIYYASQKETSEMGRTQIEDSENSETFTTAPPFRPATPPEHLSISEPLEPKNKRKGQRGRKRKEIHTEHSPTESSEILKSSIEGQASSSPDDKPPTDSTDVNEKTQSSSKKANKRRKVDDSSDGTVPKPSSSKLSKKEKAIQDFMLDILPTLKKNMKSQKTKQSPFRIREQNQYFDKGSKYLPTYLLPLFHFLGTEEITCSRYGNFDGKHMVKTDFGFKHASLLINHCEELSSDERNYLMTKYGKEWFKIPSKDGVKAASANRYGDKGEFKIILVGVYEDSFLNDEGVEVMTINPILRYDPIKLTKKESKEKE